MNILTYEELLHHVVQEGERREDRTGTGTLSVFAPPALRWDVGKDGIPITSTKKVAWKWALWELSWMLRGETNVTGLGPAAPIWEPWADENGDLGPVYGHQMRHWGKDQLQYVVDLLRDKPDTRQAVMSLWNFEQLPDMALPPCPTLFQFSRRGERYDRLDLAVYQRSADMFLGVPFDLVSQAALMQLMAEELGVQVGRLTVQYGDAHVYLNHLEQVTVMLKAWAASSSPAPARSEPPAPTPTPTPRLHLPAGGLYGFDAREATLHGYEPGPVLRGEVAV